MTIENTCCFFGHRKIEDTAELRATLRGVIEDLILKEEIETFLFGSRSEFNSLCREDVTEIKEKYPHIKRVYVRAEFPYINDDYKKYLLESYDDTYFPEHMTDAGKARYVERNREMIEKSRICVAYYNPAYIPPRQKSGTKLAYDFAVKGGRKIINAYFC